MKRRTGNADGEYNGSSIRLFPLGPTEAPAAEVKVGMSAESDDYKQQVMLTCKILLDSLSEGRKLDLLAPQAKRKLQFAARLVRLGDTFTSDSTKPIYGMLFTTEGEEYLMRKANEIGLKPMARVKVTIQPVEEGE